MRSTYSSVVCSTTFLCVVTQRSSVAWRHKERLWSRLSPADVDRKFFLLSSISIFKRYTYLAFSLFSNSPQKTYLKRFMITLDWLQIKLKLRKCWKEKNHGHRHEVDSSRIPPQRTWGTGDKVPRMSAWRATAMLLSFKTLHLLRRLLEAQGNRGIRY